MKPAASNIYTYTIYVAPDEVSYNGSVNFGKQMLFYHVSRNKTFSCLTSSKSSIIFF